MTEAGQKNESGPLAGLLAATLDAAAISKGLLFLVDPGGTLRLAHGIGFADADHARLEAFFGQRPFLEATVAGRVIVALPGPAHPPEVTRALLEGAAVPALQIVPLISEGKGVGAIVLGARHTDVTSDDAVTFARAIGNQIVKSLELQRSFARLAASEHRYRTLMESANDAIAVLTPEGQVREVNRRWEELLGRPRESLLGSRIEELAPTGQERENLEAFRGIVAAGGGRGRPTELRRADGSPVMMEFSFTLLELAGERVVLAVGRDITGQLQAQAQLMVSDRMASVGTLAAGVAHEINNPLAAVSANLELALKDLASLGEALPGSPVLAEVENELGDARDATNRVREIVRDLRIFSRDEDQLRGPVDLHRALDSSLRMAWNQIRHRARLVREYGAPGFVMANESHLGQVFLNLMVNAAQAIPEGQADQNEIRVRTYPAAAPGRIAVEIADTGRGIPPEVRQKLFTPFFTTKPPGLGTGLGLAICHRIVTGLGGEITVSSEPGRGTVFRLDLPAAAPDVATSRTPAPEVPLARRGRVLVVDDDPLMGTAVRRLLSADHDTEIVSSVPAALDRLSSDQRFDVIVCDLMMPVMTGMDLYVRLLARTPELAARMVFITGGAFTPDARAFLEEVPNPRLEKPFDLRELRALINRMLR